MAMGYGSFSGGQQFDGLVLLCIGGIVLLIATVYAADWFENVDHGLGIITSILCAAAVGGIVGFAVYGPKELLVGALLVGFAAEIAGVLCAVYFNYRERGASSGLRQF
jgi:hypothetical protein